MCEPNHDLACVLACHPDHQIAQSFQAPVFVAISILRADATLKKAQGKGLFLCSEAGGSFYLNVATEPSRAEAVG
jgi:hypothetical protein